MLDRIRVVLVNTTHPGNIGGAARAMKNMGLSDLCLVQPKHFPHRDAEARASGATDILERATVVDSIDEALAGCQLVVGTSARERHIPWPLVNPRQLASLSQQKLQSDSTAKIAVLFGREDRGLTNEELQRCHQHVNIPTNADFSSLNLAAAVQVICYEMRMALVAGETTDPPQWGTPWDNELAGVEDVERMFTHLESTLVSLDFLDPENPRQLMPRLRRLFLRAIPDQVEINIIRGILTKIDQLSVKLTHTKDEQA